MSDNRRRFVAIHSALKKLSPEEPRGNFARHLTTLAMLISGIVGSKRVHLPAIACKVPTQTKVESQVKRFSRWVSNERIDFECYYFPYARQLLANLYHFGFQMHLFCGNIRVRFLTCSNANIKKKRVVAVLETQPTKGSLLSR